jgi:hypothetical protein
MMNLHAAIKEMRSKSDEIKFALMRAVLWLTGNPKVRELGMGCFVINSSAFIGQPWSPEYHDFDWQYEKLAEIICETPFTELAAKLGWIIYHGNFKFHGQLLKFHPQVITNLKTIIKEEQ